MPRRSRFDLIYAPEVVGHLDVIEQKYHRLLKRAIDEQLSHQPAKESRNRKPIEPPAPFNATWELRCGPQNRFRVFYDVNPEAKTVAIMAIGVKEGNRLFIGKEEFES